MAIDLTLTSTPFNSHEWNAYEVICFVFAASVELARVALFSPLYCTLFGAVRDSVCRDQMDSDHCQMCIEWIA